MLLLSLLLCIYGPPSISSLRVYAHQCCKSNSMNYKEQKVIRFLRVKSYNFWVLPSRFHVI
ncbi:hypothetical protein LguiB_026473 [Lonicera macranthoides]